MDRGEEELFIASVMAFAVGLTSSDLALESVVVKSIDAVGLVAFHDVPNLNVESHVFYKRFTELKDAKSAAGKSLFAEAVAKYEKSPNDWFAGRIAVELARDRTSQQRARRVCAAALRVQPDNLGVILNAAISVPRFLSLGSDSASQEMFKSLGDRYDHVVKSAPNSILAVIVLREMGLMHGMDEARAAAGQYSRKYPKSVPGLYCYHSLMVSALGVYPDRTIPKVDFKACWSILAQIEKQTGPTALLEYRKGVTAQYEFKDKIATDHFKKVLRFNQASSYLRIAAEDSIKNPGMLKASKGPANRWLLIEK